MLKAFEPLFFSSIVSYTFDQQHSNQRYVEKFAGARKKDGPAMIAVRIDSSHFFMEKLHEKEIVQ